MCFYAVFIDLAKAFDTVNREALWVILVKLGCPTKFTTLIRLLHDDMTLEVLSAGESSERFDISNGVKQGCELAPMLFHFYFTQVILHANRDLDLGIYIPYRLDGSLFDQSYSPTAKRGYYLNRCLPVTVLLWLKMYTICR